MEDGPVYVECTKCGHEFREDNQRAAFVGDESLCPKCVEQGLKYNTECVCCHEKFEKAEMSNDGLCGYCASEGVPCEYSPHTVACFLTEAIEVYGPGWANVYDFQSHLTTLFDRASANIPEPDEGTFTLHLDRHVFEVTVKKMAP